MDSQLSFNSVTSSAVNGLAASFNSVTSSAVNGLAASFNSVILSAVNGLAASFNSVILSAVNGLAASFNPVILSAVNGLARESIHGVERPRVPRRLLLRSQGVLTTGPPLLLCHPVYDNDGGVKQIKRRHYFCARAIRPLLPTLRQAEGVNFAV